MRLLFRQRKREKSAEKGRRTGRDVSWLIRGITLCNKGLNRRERNDLRAQLANVTGHSIESLQLNSRGIMWPVWKFFSLLASYAKFFPLVKLLKYLAPGVSHVSGRILLAMTVCSHRID